MRFPSSLFVAALALAVSATWGAAQAAEPVTLSYATSASAIEANSNNVTLPSGVGSSLVVTPCKGCAPTLLRATDATTYFLRKQKVTLGNLKSAINGRSVAVTVVGSLKTHELRQVIADLDAPVPAPATTPASAPVHRPVRK